LKNHRCQWSICKKTFNGDGQGVAKPLKNHRWQWCPEEKTLPSHRLKEKTIVEVYMGIFHTYLSLATQNSPRDEKNISMISNTGRATNYINRKALCF